MKGNSKLNLEGQVWDLVKRLGNLPSRESVDSLQRRLKYYEHGKDQDLWDLITSGLEQLRSSEELARKVILLMYGNMTKLMESAEDGIVRIYDMGKHHSFLKHLPRDFSEKTVMYANLYQICKPNNEHSMDALTYVEDVRVLLGVYHNLNLAHEGFVGCADYRGYKRALKEIDDVRDFIKKRKSAHSESMALEVLGYSYSIEAAVLFHFVNLLTPERAKFEQIDLRDLERKRILIRNGLETSGLRNQMKGPVHGFYFSTKPVSEYITLPK